MKRHRRVFLVLGGFAVFAAATYMPSANAAPAAPRPLVGPDAPWSATTASNILGLTAAAVTPASNDVIATAILGLLDGLGLANTVADADLVTTLAEANSTGPVNGDAALRSFAEFANIGTVTLPVGDPIELLNFSQAAPPDNAAPQEGQIPPIDIPGVANVQLLPGEAHARWAGDNACVDANTPVARSQSGVANLSALGAVTLENAGQGAVDVTSTISLPSLPNGPGRDPRSVVGTTTAQVASVDLLSRALIIGVGSVPTLTATATGLPDGASLEYSDPVLTMSVNGGAPQPLITGSDLLPLLVPVGSLLKPVLDTIAGAVGTTSLTITTGIIPGLEEIAADGTHASGGAALLHVNLTLAGIQIINLDVLPMFAEANAPLGGLDCGGNNPFEVVKDAPDTVKSGETFTQTITVGNVSSPPCTLRAVKVVDTITGPAGFTIVSTDPQADSGTDLPVVWNNIGDIEPGQSRQLKVVIKVAPTTQTGQRFHDEATATGTCNGVPYDGTGTLDKPSVEIILARTGAATDSTLVLLGVAAMLSAAVALRRLRRA